MKKWIMFLVLLLPVGVLIPNAPAQVCVYRKPITVRVLILKHSRERMADYDANLAIRAVNNGASKGLAIKSVGNHFFTEPVANDFAAILTNPDAKVRLQRFQEFVGQQMKIDAKPGDTFIVFTIGHGFYGGGLHNIGQRSDVMKALANAAGENNQQTMWWQLSCHASSNLPSLSDLPEPQRKLFSVVASSAAESTSSDGVQGYVMDKLFSALAQGSQAIDPNGDGLITASELSAFFKGRDIPHDGGGPILFAPTPNAVLFGSKSLDISIIDRIGVQGTYPEDYIPSP